MFLKNERIEGGAQFLGETYKTSYMVKQEIPCRNTNGALVLSKY